MPLSAAQKMAAAHERQRQTIEAPAIRYASIMARQMVIAALKALRSGHSVYPAVQSFTKTLEPVMRGALLTAHLQGRIDAQITAVTAMAARAKKKISLYSSLGPYDKAVEALKSREQLTPEQVAELEKLYGDTALRVTRNLGQSVEQKCQKAAADILSQGMHVNEATARMRQAFKAAGVLPQVVVNGQARPAIFLLETLARTQVQLAYGAGRWNANQDTAIQEILWGYEYSAVMDDRTRPEHAALDGMRAPKDDPIWKKIWPPNGFACRCSTIEIFIGDKEAKGFMPDGVDDEAIADATAGGWGYNAGEVYDDGIDLPKPSTVIVPVPKVERQVPESESRKIDGVDRMKQIWSEGLANAYDVSTQKKREYTKTASQVFDKIPVAHRAKVFTQLKGTKFYNDSDHLTERLRQQGFRVPPGKVAGGAYDPKTRNLHLCDSRFGDPQKRAETFAHEFAHAVDHAGSFGTSSEWKLIWQAEIQSGGLTNYATTKPTEGFAEFMSFLWTGDKAQVAMIQREFPTCFEFCKKNGLI